MEPLGSSTPVSSSVSAVDVVPRPSSTEHSANNDHSYSDTSEASVGPDHSYTSSQTALRKKDANKQRCLKQHGSVGESLIETSSVMGMLKLSLTETVRLKLVTLSRNPEAIGKACLSIPPLREAILNNLCEEIGERPDSMKNRLHGQVSVLMRKDFTALEEYNLGDVVTEMKDKLPELVQMILAVMVPEEKRSSVAHQAVLVPRLALIYACAMQARNHELSSFQRVVSACLADNICDQKVSCWCCCCIWKYEIET